MPSAADERNAQYGKISQQALAFIQQSLPSGVADAHSLLYDWDHNHSFVPTPEQLSSCLELYTGLLLTIDSIDVIGVLDQGVMEASELVLAYLLRTLETGQKTQSDKPLSLKEVLRRILPKIHNIGQGYFDQFDAVRRLESIAETLDNFAM